MEKNRTQEFNKKTTQQEQSRVKQREINSKKIEDDVSVKKGPDRDVSGVKDSQADIEAKQRDAAVKKESKKLEDQNKERNLAAKMRDMQVKDQQDFTKEMSNEIGQGMTEQGRAHGMEI